MRISRVPATCVLAATLLSSVPAHAHSPLAGNVEEQLAGLFNLVLLGAFWLLYLLGSWQKRPAVLRACCFHLACLVCALAVLGPLDDWAKTSTAAHMTQHMLLMVVIAPLWVISAPLAQIMAGGGRVMRGMWRGLWRPLLGLSRHPMTGAYIHGAVIWFWHMPYFYMLAVEHVGWHAVEHLCFLISAGLFWWPLLKGSRHHRHWALLALLFTLMHTGFLGALLTFARAPLYGEARSLQDQQLAGLIMWVAGAIPYLATAAWVGLGWLNRSRDKAKLKSATSSPHLPR